MINKIHQQTRFLLFTNEKKDWPYLVQVLILLLLVAFPVYGGTMIFDSAVALDILAIVLILYGIILLEKPSILLLITGLLTIIILLIKTTGVIILSEFSTYWLQRIAMILPITYFALLGIRLLGDTLAEKVSTRLLYISVSNYLTIGILFNFVYQLIHINNLQAFNFSPEIKYNYLYMSFIVLSTVGLGDLLPLSTVAKSVVMIEAIAGQLYLTFFVALIIGKYLAEHSQNNPRN